MSEFQNMEAQTPHRIGGVALVFEGALKMIGVHLILKKTREGVLGPSI